MNKWPPIFQKGEKRYMKMREEAKGILKEQEFKYLDFIQNPLWLVFEMKEYYNKIWDFKNGKWVEDKK